MKKILFLLIALAFSFAAPANAQQNQQLRRSRSIFLYPEFQKAKIRQSFGRFVEAEANIYLKDASLVYKENGKIMRAYTKGIFGVTFADTAEYVKVDSVMARVVAKGLQLAALQNNGQHGALPRRGKRGLGHGLF